MSNFTGQQINLTYKSLLHFSNDNGLTVNTRFRLYDGAGVATCLQLAASGETPIFDTDVRVNEVLYPGEMGNQFDIMYQTDSDGTLALGNIYDVLSFANSGQAVNGTISNVKSQIDIEDYTRLHWEEYRFDPRCLSFWKAKAIKLSSSIDSTIFAAYMVIFSSAHGGFYTHFRLWGKALVYRRFGRG